MSASLFRPSAAHRWIECPGSWKANRDFEKLHGPEKTSEYALEGQRAHSLAEQMIDADLDELKPDDFGDFSGEMFHYAKEYVAYVQQETPSGDLYVEKKIDLTDFFYMVAPFADFKNGKTLLSGTADVIHIQPGLVQVFDLKYGKGVEVDAIGNEQLAIYGFGAVLLHNEKYPKATIKDIKMHIFQPRISSEPKIWHIVDWEVDLFLKSEEKNLINAMSGAMGGNPTFKAGDHCKFCRCQVTCPTIRKQIIPAIQDDFGEPDIQKVIEETDLEKLVRIHENTKTIQSFLQAVSGHLHDLASNGTEIPGHKLVNQYGNRTWALDDPDMVKKFRNQKLKQDEYISYKVKSPNQMKTVLKNKKFFEKWVTRPLKGTALVPLSDKREAVETSPKADFADSDLSFLGA